MQDVIELALRSSKDASEIKEMKRVSGGSINDSFYVQTEQHEYFIKSHTNPPENFFKLEKEGLEYIKSTKSIQVPEVYSYSDEIGKAYLALEWIDGSPQSSTQLELGRNIAKMHQAMGEGHGYHEPTYIGIIIQSNQMYRDWVDYYRECRLKRQLQIGVDEQHITGKRRERLERVITDLEKWIPQDIKPSYLHGDLWAGNWICDANGTPYVIDPSFLFGDRHLDLAFTELFGGFSEDFYKAYEQEYPIDHYYDDVKALYQLYYLLVHLNIFGEAYSGSVDRVLKYYVGE
ncbi:fructosamine kinase family protein [Aquisalibacillus elongatus]|uniref:Fructosamine-3-kinase n=1 Tax=Aquisalibacillus elongatus TaxID=485577 RepID=A0A3N5BD85_9BACI|nr:fructosamine kinase family protein [Aquisalibacillus elongatus]RPF55443.1 fructosamine-3-kinase [Aquisalibacillus elongatus]